MGSKDDSLLPIDNLQPDGRAGDLCQKNHEKRSFPAFGEIQASTEGF